MSSQESTIIIPRPFKLRLEYDASTGKKDKTYLTQDHATFISYGLHSMTQAQKEDPKFDCVGFWEGFIIGIQGQRCGEVIYNWVAKIPQNYPEEPPIIRFVTAVSLPCVDSRGYVDVKRIPNYSWLPSHNLANVLMALREAMKDKHSIDSSYKLIGKTFFEQYPPSEVEKNFQ